MRFELSFGMWAFVAAIALLPAVATAQSNSPVTITINYVNLLDRVRPSPQKGIVTNLNFVFTLSGQNTVQEQWDTRSGRSSRQSSSTRTLGVRSDSGEQWRVAGAKQLVRRTEYPQNWTIITVTVTGPTSCRAKVEYVLKPGFHEYTFKRLVSREIAYYSRAEVTSTACHLR